MLASLDHDQVRDRFSGDRQMRLGGGLLGFFRISCRCCDTLLLYYVGFQVEAGIDACLFRMTKAIATNTALPTNAALVYRYRFQWSIDLFGAFKLHLYASPEDPVADCVPTSD